jgi:hypothetical protein
MSETPRPQELGEQRTPVAPEPDDHGESAADPHSEPGARSEPGPAGVAKQFPYALVVIGVVFAAVLVLTLVWVVFPPR